MLSLCVALMAISQTPTPACSCPTTPLPPRIVVDLRTNQVTVLDQNTPAPTRIQQPAVDRFAPPSEENITRPSRGNIALRGSVAGEVYTVEAGDELWRIAYVFNQTVRDVARMNGITDVNRIEPGQKLTVRIRRQDQPTTTAAPATTPVAPVPANPQAHDNEGLYKQISDEVTCIIDTVAHPDNTMSCVLRVLDNNDATKVIDLWRHSMAQPEIVNTIAREHGVDVTATTPATTPRS